MTERTSPDSTIPAPIGAEATSASSPSSPDKMPMYILWALTALFPLFGIIFAYIKNGSARDEFERSHCRYAIRTFWWGMLWSFIGAILSMFMIGVPVLFALAIWYVYRIVKGLVRTSEGKPVRK